MKVFCIKLLHIDSNYCIEIIAPMVQLHSDIDLAPNRLQTIIWTTDGLVYWFIYASPHFDELTNWGLNQHVGSLRKLLENTMLWRKTVFISISLDIIPKGLIDANYSRLVLVGGFILNSTSKHRFAVTIIMYFIMLFVRVRMLTFHYRLKIIEIHKWCEFVLKYIMH